ncbi:MAG TPA: hypothetical protein VIN93_02560, partial [Bryobacteraceae bacterium]
LSGYGSPFPVRYVSGGLLFLKPLGTFINMNPPEVFVNLFLYCNSLFPQVLFTLFLCGYKATVV